MIDDKDLKVQDQAGSDITEASIESDPNVYIPDEEDKE